ncbi:hypothetical protein DPMN_139441 [Dreissena polymorpha]|uniref:Uncharacterized protein n=1 Tax=Dreissena polymorpha TaxID=45954 RepID=A0A9D4JI49_DREPO|nr:hypothetical protein DPMN_139441 [Dreissena polymorpha]
MTHMTILVENGSVDLFEILRDTGIGIMSLSNAESASYASKILYTFKNLTKLHLWGTFSGRCSLQLPVTMQCISLQKVECSAEWLCSLLSALSSLDHSLLCELLDVVFQPYEYSCGDDSQTNASDLRSEILSLDMRHMTMSVINGSVELFELLRDTSLGILDLKTADCASSASKILYNIKQLTTLHLWGTYNERCTLKLPATLQCISLQKVECSAECLCSMLIALSSLAHSVQCEMYDVVFQSFEYSCGRESQTHVSDLRSEILALDMTHMTILVEVLNCLKYCVIQV